MIQLQRDRTRVPPSFLDPARQVRLLELFRAGEAGQLGAAGDKKVKDKILSSSRWNATKKQLGIESAGKCAFCETPTSAAYFGDVEHFRPKSLYWWLAYCYDNYLYSCRVCNGAKSDLHQYTGPASPPPVIPAASDDAALLLIAAAASPSPADAPGLAALSASLDAEIASLPNPYNENPELLFAWEADDVLREVKMVARPANPRSGAAVKTAEEVLGINRPELKIWRWKTYSGLSRLQSIAANATGQARDDTLDMLREMASGDFPYSAMVRYFARESWGLI